MAQSRWSRRGIRRLTRALCAAIAVAVLAGCGGPARDAGGGSDRGPSAEAVSSADQACRAKWQALGATVSQHSQLGVDLRTAFAGRWNAIAAGVDLYARTADASQCGDLLATRRTTVQDLTDLVERALPYDATQQSATAFAKRQMYAALPGGRREPARVQRAYAVVRQQTPTAAADIAPAYAELARAEPGDTKAVALAFSDIRLLARTSDADQACTRALRTVQAWNESLIRRTGEK